MSLGDGVRTLSPANKDRERDPDAQNDEEGRRIAHFCGSGRGEQDAVACDCQYGREEDEEETVPQVVARPRYEERGYETAGPGRDGEELGADGTGGIGVNDGWGEESEASALVEP